MIKRRPLLDAALWWMSGSAAAYLCPGWVSYLLCWCGVVLAAPLFARLTTRTWKRITVLLLLFTLAGLYWKAHEAMNVTELPRDTHMSVNDLAGKQVHIEGTIVSEIKRDGDKISFVSSISSIQRVDTKLSNKVGGERLQVQMKLTEQQEIRTIESWSRGMHIQMSGTLETPPVARNFGDFDYGRYLHNKRIHWIFQGNGVSSTQVVRDGISLERFLGSVSQLRGRISEQIDSLFGDIQAGYMKGLLIGDTDTLDSEIYQGFSALGLTHILAISGSHVAINLSILYGLLRVLKVARERALLVMLLFVPLYMLLTGLSPSVVRSGLMALIGLYLLRRQLLKDGLNLLAAAAFMMLLWNPYYMLDVSFQLSFAVTAGLILGVPMVLPWFSFLPKHVAETAAITFTAQLTSFPLTIYYFNQFSLLSFAANFVIVPFVSLLALPIGTAALLVSFMWYQAGGWLAFIVKLINDVTFILVDWMDSRSGHMLIWKSPALWWILVYVGLVYALLVLCKMLITSQSFDTYMQIDDTVPLNPNMNQATNQQRFQIGGEGSIWHRFIDRLTWKQGLPILLILMLIGTLYIGYRPAYADGYGYVQFIDVGQGDSILITTPQGKHILVDGGGTVTFRKKTEAWRGRKEPYEVGAKVVVPLLKHRGIHKLDAIIISHWDQDHAGGLLAVLDHIPVDSLILNESLTETKTCTDLMIVALKRNVPIYFAETGMKLKPDSKTEIDFLAPFHETDLIASSPNQPESISDIPVIKEQNGHSIVFLLRMLGHTLLFTGDMDVKEEERVMQQLDNHPEPIDVIKVAHHGSKTSSSEQWLKFWQAKNAVISVGLNNSYGHPNPGIVDRIEETGAHIYRTDLMGEVQLRVSKESILYRNKITEYTK